MTYSCGHSSREDYSPYFGEDNDLGYGRYNSYMYCSHANFEYETILNVTASGCPDCISREMPFINKLPKNGHRSKEACQRKIIEQITESKYDAGVQFKALHFCFRRGFPKLNTFFETVYPLTATQMKQMLLEDVYPSQKVLERYAQDNNWDVLIALRDNIKCRDLRPGYEESVVAKTEVRDKAVALIYDHFMRLALIRELSCLPHSAWCSDVISIVVAHL